MKIIIITDHSTHVKTDSIFHFSEMFKKRKIDVYIASRHTVENAEFFHGKSVFLSVKLADTEFNFKKENSWYFNLQKVNINDFDYVLLRLDSPICDTWLIWLNQILEIPCVNNPIGIHQVRRRNYLLHLKEDALNSKFLKSLSAIRDEVVNKNCVIKLDDSYGGSGVIRFVGESRINKFDAISRDLINRVERNIDLYGGVFIQDYSENVTQGDKRYFVAFGNILGSLIRMPAKGSWLCNLNQGGHILPSIITEKEHEMIKRVDAKIAPLGIHLYAIDTLINENNERKVSELNVTNPGGFVQLQDIDETFNMSILSDIFFEGINNPV